MALSITVDRRGISAALKKRVNEGTLLTNNTTYAAGGLALPAKEAFGFVRSMDTLEVYGMDSGQTTTYLFTYDKANQKLQFFEGVAASTPLAEEGAVATGTRTYRYIATGW